MKLSLVNLIKERDEIVAKINKIEEDSEGMDNIHNAKKIKSIEMEKAELLANKNTLKVQISLIDAKLNELHHTVSKLSNKGREKIYEAIKNQRWFFIKNKPTVLFDKLTGYLWPNLDYFKYRPDNDNFYTISASRTLVQKLEIDDFKHWQLPSKQDVMGMIEDKSFPFHKGNYYHILGNGSVYIENHQNTSEFAMWLDGDYPKLFPGSNGFLIPCYKGLVEADYKNNIRSDNKVFSEKERLQFTLDVFLENQFIPIFKNAEITELYYQIYFEKPRLIQRANEMIVQIESFQQETLLSATFDFEILLSKYHLDEIDASVIKYYQSIQLWVTELLDKISEFEKNKKEVISEYNMISLSLSKKHEQKQNLNENENNLFQQRKEFLKKNFALGMNQIQNQLLSLKNQAEEYEDRIENILSSTHSLKELAIIEEEKKPSFHLIAEHTANLIKNGLIKIEFFEKNKEFAKKAIKLESDWLEDYEVFTTKLRDDFKMDCEEDSIDEGAWVNWLEDWRKTRFIIETNCLPLIEMGLMGKLSGAIILELLEMLQGFKKGLDQFYLEERKNIHQKFAFQFGGDLQEKFEVESELYKLTSKIQLDLQDIIFKIEDLEGKITVLKLMDKLMDIQIDEILSFIHDQDLTIISMEVLNEFSQLKQKNFEIYIQDSKSFNEERIIREKEYNSLMFKMRKDLMKQGQKV